MMAPWLLMAASLASTPPNDGSGAVSVALAEDHPVTTAAWSRDGTLLATGGSESDVTLWDAHRGVRRGRLRGYGTGAECLAFSPAADLLAAAHGDCVTLWDLAAKTARKVETAARSGPRSLAFSPAGGLLAVIHEDGTASVLRVPEGAAGADIRAAHGNVGALYFSPSGLLAVGEGDKIVVRDAPTGQVRQTLEGHTGAVLQVAWSPSGKLLASLGADRELRLWDTAAWRLLANSPIRQYVFNPQLHDLSFSPDGRWVVLGGYDGLMIWNTQDLLGQALAAADDPVERLRQHAAGREGVAVDPAVVIAARLHQAGLSPDGTMLALIPDEAPPLLWDTATLQATPNDRPKRDIEFTPPYTSSGAVAISPDGRVLFIPREPETNHIGAWDLSTGKKLYTLDGTRNQRAVAMHPSGKLLATAGRDVTLRDPDTGRRLGSFPCFGPNGTEAYELRFSQDGRYLAAIGADVLSVFETRRWSTQGPQPLGDGYPAGLGITSDSASLAYRLLNRNVVEVRDLRSGTVRHRLEAIADAGNTHNLAVSPREPLVAFTHGEKLEVWDYAAERLRRELPEPFPGRIERLTFSGDGQTLVGCMNPDSRIHHVLLWDLPSGKLRAMLGEPSTAAALFTPDGRQLVVVSRRIRVWDWPVSNDLYFSPGLDAAAVGRADELLFVSGYLDRTLKTRCTLARSRSGYSLSIAIPRTAADDPPVFEGFEGVARNVADALPGGPLEARVCDESFHVRRTAVLGAPGATGLFAVSPAELDAPANAPVLISPGP